MTLRPAVLAFSALLVVGLTGPRASAGYVYRFTGVTNNNATNTAAGAAQLTVDVSDAGTVVIGGNTVHRVAFKFLNNGPSAMSITDLYFDDGTLLGIASITNGPGVSFSVGGSPPNLPGGNAINFHTSAGFLADSDPPVQANGVNPGEWVRVTFNLINGKTYSDTLAAMQLSLNNPGVDMTNGLRIGIHVQGFSGGGSESFVNGAPITPAPAPTGLALVLSALPVLGLRRLIRRQCTA